jgi:CDP-glucose 4,6-dehydratase
MRGTLADIRSIDALALAFDVAAPDIVLHLAAQPLVGLGYEQPAQTFAVNVMGTVNVLELARRLGVEAVIVMTSDKVYAASDAPHVESDQLGANDPYAASKACCEFAAEAYGRAFFDAAKIGLATVRAGNVIGGGDWSDHRLVPDAVRAFAAKEPLRLRHPQAVRPWQHVLDAVAGMLVVAQRAARQQRPIGPWNIGPPPDRVVTVGALAEMVAQAWGDGAAIAQSASPGYPETGILALDPNWARRELGVAPPWTTAEIVNRTVSWYKRALAGEDAWALTHAQIEAYSAGCLHRTEARLRA